MNRLIAFVTVAGLALLAGCDGASSFNAPTQAAAGVAFNEKGGNSDAAHACQQGGWQTLMGSDGTLFRNTGDCVSYAAHGGTLMAIPTGPTITSFTYDGIVNNCATGGGVHALFTAVFSNGTGTITDASGTATPVTSGVQVPLGANGGDFVLTVTNSSGTAVTQTLSDPTGIPTGAGEGCPSSGGLP